MVSPDERSTLIREQLTIEQRVADGTLTIDPGFVNHRKIETLIGSKGVGVIDSMMRDLPPMPDWQREVRIDHIYTRVLLKICENTQTRPLRAVIGDRRGTVFNSVESISPTPDVYSAERAISRVSVAGFSEFDIELHYSTSKIRADTTRAHLHTGHDMAIIGEINRLVGKKLIVEPLIMGAPWLTVDESIFADAEWYGHDFFQNFIEDIDNFSLVRSTASPNDFSIMKSISELAFKTCLAEILGDQVVKDWGGEMSDHYSAHLTLGGRRVDAAFLLKGPARFAPMGLNHLGKNNDQIYRLSQEPAGLLVVQHCHDVQPAVRATLRAFSVQPAMQRRYCVIDGRDSLRLLQAYDKVDRALELSQH